MIYKVSGGHNKYKDKAIMDLIKSKTYKLFYGSCNMDGDLKLNKLADIFSELADEQVDDLKSYYTFLNNKQYRWILVRYNIQIKHMIHAGEIFKISTYQSFYSKYTCIRDYIVENKNGEEIIYAACQWIMKDDKCGRICAVPKEYENLTASLGKEKRSELPKIEEFACTKAFKLHNRYDDYDYNRHVNNAKYFLFITDEHIPFEKSKYRVCDIDTNYKAGMIYGNKYMICNEIRERNDEILLYQKIFDENTTAALMRSIWKLI